MLKVDGKLGKPINPKEGKKKSTKEERAKRRLSVLALRVRVLFYLKGMAEESGCIEIIVL